MFRTKKRREHNNAVNAGSMADIAFLLLIFFLVTTTILIDKGIMVKLPPWAVVPPSPIDQERVLTVKVNALDQLLVEDNILPAVLLKEKTKEFITAYLLAHQDTGSKPLISLQNDRSTTYEMYLEVYNELKAAYNELWEAEALKNFGTPYADLFPSQQKTIRAEIPLVISEAEPTEYAVN